MYYINSSRLPLAFYYRPGHAHVRVGAWALRWTRDTALMAWHAVYEVPGIPGGFWTSPYAGGR